MKEGTAAGYDMRSCQAPSTFPTSVLCFVFSVKRCLRPKVSRSHPIDQERNKRMNADLTWLLLQPDVHAIHKILGKHSAEISNCKEIPTSYPACP